MESDPIEPFNRAMHEFNYTIDGVILRPVASIYRGIMPETGREMVTNAIENLYTPVVFFNSVLQLDPENSFVAFWRFVINSTVGIGGVFDVASEAGLKMRPADLGQTFAVYGAESGAYVVLPIIGPSNVRDSLGRLGDALMNPFNHIDEGLSYAIWSATAVDQRSNNMELIDDVYKNSLDPYATFRSGYTQKRAADIKRAKTMRAKSQEKALNP
ncbi:MAG: VacJ family lipoprotein [Alphaproteobacteria bacterium]